MTKFDKQFEMDAVQYYHDHRDLGLIGCAHNLGISQQTLSRWQKQLRDNGEMPYRGSGNYASDEAKNNLIRQDQTRSGAVILLIFGPLKDLCI